ncbi:MAG: RNA polymerase subunit sigma [Marinilabiliales bacterium]|nr:MAG: RNA polymerase subunit sigma [Marinilabiliales bacterium]
MKTIEAAANLIKTSKNLSSFTGAGISVESGIPVFRGKEGVYSKYEHKILEINYYKNNTEESWCAILDIFYDKFTSAKPNTAHKILAQWEKLGILKYIITQNIDNLHRESGSKNIVEYHGNKEFFICFECKSKFSHADIKLSKDPPKCPKCGGLLKPDFVFFGEPIPSDAACLYHDIAKTTDVHLIIGTTGEVQPASYIPVYAKKTGAKIIEINTKPSKFTDKITDVFIEMKASEALTGINELIN